MAATQRTRPVYTPASVPPQGLPPSPAILEAMGEHGVFELFEDFYARLGASDVAQLFPDDLVGASQRSAAFFVQLLGGPPLYSSRYGPPRMRQRHLPFEIDEAARETWLACFEATLVEAPARYGFPDEHMPGFKAFLVSFSAWMVNAQ